MKNDKLRNIAIIAHVDHGKTSLVNELLKQGGVLIYSTCTYSIEENENVVKTFMQNYGYEIVNINAPFSRGVDLEDSVRLYPHIVKGEGQFVAVLKKVKENDLVSSACLKLKEDKNAQKFIEKHINIEEISKKYEDFEYLIRKFGNYSYFVPDVSLIKKDVNYVSVGVKLGEDLKDRFEPDHYIFSAFGEYFKLKLNLKLNDDRVLKYLKGETFETDLSDGYGAIFVEGCSLGGFKISKEKFKNHYPKGLRNLK